MEFPGVTAARVFLCCFLRHPNCTRAGAMRLRDWPPSYLRRKIKRQFSVWDLPQDSITRDLREPYEEDQTFPAVDCCLCAVVALAFAGRYRGRRDHRPRE